MRCGFYVFPRHHDCIEEIRQLRPSLVKAFASVTSNDWWKAVHQASPQSIRVLVHGEVSDNPSLEHPEADAEATARYLDDKPDCPRLVILKNEPPIWNGRDVRQAVVTYTTRWLARAHALGLNGVVGEFNSGWPRVSLLDSEDWWPEFAPIDAAMNDGDYYRGDAKLRGGIVIPVMTLAATLNNGGAYTDVMEYVQWWEGPCTLLSGQAFQSSYWDFYVMLNLNYQGANTTVEVALYQYSAGAWGYHGTTYSATAYATALNKNTFGPWPADEVANPIMVRARCTAAGPVGSYASVGAFILVPA